MHAYVTSLKTCLANTCSSTRVQPRACYQGKYRRASSYYHVTRTTYFRAVLRAVLIEELFVLNFLIILFFSAHFFFFQILLFISIRLLRVRHFPGLLNFTNCVTTPPYHSQIEKIWKQISPIRTTRAEAIFCFCFFSTFSLDFQKNIANLTFPYYIIAP